MVWILVRDTKLAKETSPKAAGLMFKKAGFLRKSETVRKASNPCGWTTQAYVDARAEHLSKTEVMNMIPFKKAGAIVPAPPSPEPPPSYAEVVEALEKQDALIIELRDEIRQLRAHIATIQHRNGMGDRARKALSAARQTLSLVNGE